MFSNIIIKQKLLSKLLRSSFSAETKVYGGLKDQDRIFTNLYGDNDAYIAGALKRVKEI